MDNANSYICGLLRKSTDWITFDELCSRIPNSHDWTGIAARLERLVEIGIVQYRLLPGADVGQYRMK